MINLKLFENSSPAIRAMVRDINNHCRLHGIDIFEGLKNCGNCKDQPSCGTYIDLSDVCEAWQKKG